MRKTLMIVVALLALPLVDHRRADPHGELKEEVALDNECVRVAMLTVPPGSSSGIHLNAEPEIGIVLEGELTLVTRRGKEVLKAGRVVYLPTGTGHDARNEGGQPVKLWALNLKKCE
jgi:quercetin dioxygenase-like cupin family protein